MAQRSELSPQKVPKPTDPEIRTILKQTLASVEVGSVDWEAIVQKLNGFSAAQIVKIAQNAAKRAILDREDLVIQEHLEAAIQDLIVSHAGERFDIFPSVTMATKPRLETNKRLM